MKSTMLRTDKGFTLVEVLAAALLLSIALLAVMTASQAARETQRRAVYLSIGRNIAQSKIETLRAASFDSLTSMGSSSQSPALPPGNSIAVTVSRYPTSTDKHLCRAQVTVSWPEARGTRTIRYEALIARN